jgi:hypothetical protein
MTAESGMEEKKATRRKFLKTTAYAGAGSVAGAAALNAVSAGDLAGRAGD